MQALELSDPYNSMVYVSVVDSDLSFSNFAIVGRLLCLGLRTVLALFSKAPQVNTVLAVLAHFFPGFLLSEDA